jgi:hypothetical protein
MMPLERKSVIVLCALLIAPTFFEAMALINSEFGLLWIILYSIYHFPLWALAEGFWVGYSPEAPPFPKPPGRLLVMALYLFLYFVGLYVLARLRKSKELRET